MSRRFARRHSAGRPTSPRTANRPDPRRSPRPPAVDMILPPAGDQHETAPVRPAAVPGTSQATPAPTPDAGTVPIETSALEAPPAVAADAHPENAPPEQGAHPDNGLEARACTAAQLRRFIKSRPYVPLHELRRRFELNGAFDDVTPIATSSGTVYVGLPPREATFIADLVSQGDVGLELCRDPFVPIVVGVYAMRPISRQ